MSLGKICRFISRETVAPWCLANSYFVRNYSCHHVSQDQSAFRNQIINQVTAPIFTSRQIVSVDSFPNKPRYWVFRGDQRGCYGGVSVSKVEEIVASLGVKSPLGICFNKNKITSFLMGGACSALALEFVERYLRLQKDMMSGKIENQEPYFDRVKKIGTHLAQSCEAMRTRQRAFNTIEVIQPCVSLDPFQSKVQALANFHSLFITHSSTEINVHKQLDEAEVCNVVDGLPNGAYFLRIIKPAQNEKLEEHGHSLVFVKENGMKLVYDPNFGLENLAGEKPSRALLQSFITNFNSYQVSKARFYRLELAD